MEFLKSNLWEIKKSTAVATFGAMVALGHILIFFDWFQQSSLPLRLARESAPMCWPLLSPCDFWLALPDSLLGLLFAAYLMFAACAFFLFLFTRLSSVAWFFLSFAFVSFLILYFRDYRLSSNEHYFWLLVTLIYLFIPNKENTLRFFILSYWVALGAIRLNPEWMTGLWIMDYAALPVKLAEWIAALSVLTLMIAPFGLFFKDGRYLAVSAGMLALLHSFIWIISDYFSPALSLCALSFFILHWWEQRKLEREYIYQSFIRPEPSRVWLIIVLVIFWAGQFTPYVPVKKPWMTKMGEAIALTPLPPIEECNAEAFARFKTSTRHLDLRSVFEARSEELKCHPQLNFLELKNLCSKLAKEQGFENLQVSFFKRGFKDVEFKKVFETANICKPGVNFSELVGSNGVR